LRYGVSLMVVAASPGWERHWALTLYIGGLEKALSGNQSLI